jgi:hypothetical protein
MKYVLSILLLAIVGPALGQEHSDHNLFWIERSKDANKIYYVVNVDESGSLDKEDPIDIYWIKHENHGEKEPLTWIQSRLAYGIRYLKVSEEEVEFQFVSYKKIKLLLKQTSDGYSVFMKLNNRLMELQKVFVQIDGGSFMFPKIPYVKLYGINPKTDKKIHDTIIP